MRLPTALALLVAVLSSHPAVPAEPVTPLPPELVDSWRRILIGLQQPAAGAAGAFVWEGELPAAVTASPANPVAPARDPASLLDMLGATPVAATDVAIWLLADTGTAAATPLLLRLSAREWATQAAEKMLAAVLSRRQAAVVVPTLLSAVPEPEPAKPPPLPLVLEPVARSRARK